MKHALISEDQIKRVQRALKTSKAIACGAKPNAFALGYVDESIEIVESLKPSEPVAWKDQMYGRLSHQDWGNGIPLFALEHSK